MSVLALGTAAVCFRVRGRIRGVLLRRLLRQSFKLVDEGGIGGGIEI